MKQIIFLLFLLKLISSSYGQTSLNCDSLLNKTPNFLFYVKGQNDSLIKIDAIVFRDCGRFDSLDYALLKVNLGWFLLHQSKPMNSITYKSLVDSIKAFRNDDKNKKYILTLSTSLLFEKKIADIKNWDADKEIFIQLGFPQTKQDTIKEFIFKPENSNLTYKQVLIKLFGTDKK